MSERCSFFGVMKCLCMLLFFGVSVVAGAQRVALREWTVSSLGGGASSVQKQSVISISQVVGQPSPIGHMRAGGAHLLQGFHHPYLRGRTFFGIDTPKLSLFPNPSTGLVTVTADWHGYYHNKEDKDKEIVVSLVDMEGRLVKQESIANPTSDFQLDYAAVPKGAYRLIVTGGKATVVSLLLILK